jgi:hypothetical protein
MEEVMLRVIYAVEQEAAIHNFGVTSELSRVF